jgi:hypothetical protein
VLPALTYTKISSAISSLPSNNELWTVSVGSGTYVEQVVISRSNTIILSRDVPLPGSQNNVNIHYNVGEISNQFMKVKTFT